MSTPASEDPHVVDESTMTPEERAELAWRLAWRRAVAEKKLIALAAARRDAETAVDQAENVLAVAWRANQKRPRTGRYTATAVAAVAHIDRDTLAKYGKADDRDDKPDRPEGDYSLDDFAALGAARTAARKALDDRTDELVAHWQNMQADPRTRMKLLTTERLVGIPRATLRAWLLGTHNPYGLKRTKARDAVAGSGQLTVTVNRRTADPARRRRNTGSGKRKKS